MGNGTNNREWCWWWSNNSRQGRGRRVCLGWTCWCCCWSWVGAHVIGTSCPTTILGNLHLELGWHSQKRCDWHFLPNNHPWGWHNLQVWQNLLLGQGYLWRLQKKATIWIEPTCISQH